MSIGPTGGHAYLSTASNASTVCAAVDTPPLFAPATVTTVDELFHSLRGSDVRLDVTHACYLNMSQRLPQCVATLQSTAADCGGVAAEAVGPLLNSSSRLTDVATSSAALLASYVHAGAAQRLRLERSLRRTREVVSALSRVHDLVLQANDTISDAHEMHLLRARATQYVKEVVEAAYDRVMDKYYVLDAWTNASLGITAQHLSFAAGPAGGTCAVHNYTHRLLWGTEASSIVLLALTQTTLSIADSIHNRTYSPAARGVQCAQVLTGLVMMTLEDDAVRQVAAMIAGNTLTATVVWEVSDFALLLPSRTTPLRQRQLWSLAYVFAAVADPIVVDDLVGSAAVAECMRRAALVVPDPVTGSVPPSISWCLENASTSEMMPTAVAQRSLAVRESDTAANGRCLWGLSVWDGLCDGAAFDAARCESCPPGSVGDGEGHCVCGDATATYPTLTSGCMPKGAAHDVAGLRLLQANGQVSVPGAAAVPLLSVQLPQTAALADPTAFLRVNVTCVDGGRGGGTRLLATPQGNRTAVCASVVAYERHEERTGSLHTFRGTQFFETYAENLTISVLGSAAFFGETCRMEVVVQSASRRASRSVVAGTWTFIPAAEAFTLEAHSYPGSVSPNAAAAPSDVPLCSHAMLDAVNSRESRNGPVVQVDVCRTTSGGPALLVQPNAYSVFGTSTQQAVGQRIRRSAGTSRDASFIATLQSLTSRTGFQLMVEGGTGSDVLWSAAWVRNATPLAVNAWASGWVVPIESCVLRNMRSFRLRVADTANTSAFVAFEAAVQYQYGSDAEIASSSSDGSDKGSEAAAKVPGVHYDFWYVILFIVVSVLDAVVLAAFGLMVFLRHASYDKWPTCFK
ncbi:putative transmembrane protein [Leptomonas pyrrhocoris]|uniref:Putative transmembrane protein n=1 Tax=Leptomonas pyrrhocoris TaxID=157538 RepID=A0A0N0DUN7_LEPPY|nr:putative transmembrane protein [Leptomonas pyrrhocoris]KPA79212.1 putative transmembrane protein [Leptomonas pyrrhocoris]|eukprot:XP_015657651.1 putative transmembrane protein [Leptomonas pyrrhocoris]